MPSPQARRVILSVAKDLNLFNKLEIGLVAPNPSPRMNSYLFSLSLFFSHQLHLFLGGQG
jgi:hypothetical protein